MACWNSQSWRFRGAIGIAVCWAFFSAPASAEGHSATRVGPLNTTAEFRIPADGKTGAPEPPGVLGRAVIVAAKKGGRKKGSRPRGVAAPAAASGPRLDGQVPLDAIDQETRCAIGRSPSCDIKVAIKRGLFETGLRPRFPEGLDCRDIDEQWAISYTHKRPRENYHGGIDMPAPFGTPIVAVAAGTVVGKYDPERSFRGIEIILRHGPEDTGIPLWIYTQYAHFDQVPKVRVGQRVRMGEVLGPTGNSGIAPSQRRSGKQRRPAIHFAVWFSTSRQYVAGRGKVIPVDGHWMDPNALYRGKPPFDSYAMKALPEGGKRVPIPVMVKDAATVPAATKLVWPYSCARD